MIIYFIGDRLLLFILARCFTKDKSENTVSLENEIKIVNNYCH